MNQMLLALDAPAADPIDRVGFHVGWDHARHARVPPAPLMQSGTAVGQGWAAGRAVFGPRSLAAGRGMRRWLALRLQAWQEGAAFDERQVTPELLVQLEPSHCPVTRRALGGDPQGDDAPVVARLRLDAGYAAGNLVVLSHAAVRARGDRDASALAAHAARLARDGTAPDQGLAADAWARLATLASLAADLEPVQAARIALRVLPPERVRVPSPIVGLQAMLTLRLHDAGWSRRARAVADRLPRQALRHDFNLFVGAIAARLMAIPADAGGHELRWALEDAWACGRVQRRWSAFAVQVSAAEAEALLQQLSDGGLAGVQSQRREPPSAKRSHWLVHTRESAVEGWSLSTRGRVARSPRSTRLSACAAAALREG